MKQNLSSSGGRKFIHVFGACCFLLIGIFTVYTASISSFQTDKPFLFIGERCNYGKPFPVFTLFDEKNRQMAIAQDGEIRWFDNIKKPPVKTVKIGEIPEFEFSIEEKKLIDEAVKWHESVYGDIPENYFGSTTLLQRPGGKEFCITDRDSKFYFYSTETGELLRKTVIQKPKNIYRPRATMLSDDNKVVLTENLDIKKAFVHSMETGKLILAVESQIFDTVALTPDGSTLIQLKAPNIIIRYSIKTGKKSAPDFVIKSETAGALIISPSGNKIAFDLYAKGKANGQAIMDLSNDKITTVDLTVKKYSTLAFTPNGKFLAVHLPMYIHFVDTTTGQHSFSYNTGYPDIWDRVINPSFSPDSSKLSFPMFGMDVYRPYFIYCDLSQPRVKVLEKIDNIPN